MDMSNRDAQHEKSEKQLKLLKESYKGMFKNYSKDLLNEDAFATQKKLKKPLKEEGNPFAKKDDDSKDEKPEGDDKKPEGDEKPADSEPKADAPKEDAAPEGDVPPVSTGTPEGADLNSQDQLSTREFASAFLKGLPSDVDLQNSVDANGIFKASVNDQQHGQFTILAFPASKTSHQVADLVEPALPGAAAGAGAPVAGALPAVDPAAPAVPPVDPAAAGAAPAVVPPVAGAVPPVAGDVPPAAPVVPPVSDAVPPVPVEEPVVKEVAPPAAPVVAPVPAAVAPVAPAACMDPRCTDPNCKEHGMDAGAMMESEREKQRDPILEGRKNWNSMVKKLLTEGKKALEKKEELKEEASADTSKLEARIKSIEGLIASETDAEEKKELQIALGKVKMALSRAKNPTKVDSHPEAGDIAAE